MGLFFILLPYVEQGNIYNNAVTGYSAIPGYSAYTLASGTDYHKQPLSLFLCPSDASPTGGLTASGVTGSS
jgi:Protein of unknown function (DUF1559)